MSASVMREHNIEGNSVPDICRPDYIPELVERENGFFADFLSWPMSAYDTRQQHPSYFTDYINSKKTNKTLNL